MSPLQELTDGFTPEGKLIISTETRSFAEVDVNIIYTKKSENGYSTVPNFRMFGLNVLGIDAIIKVSFG